MVRLGQARVSNARWGEFGGCAAEEVELRAQGSQEGGKSPVNNGPRNYHLRARSAVGRV
jgi:hypothetical protein